MTLLFSPKVLFLSATLLQNGGMKLSGRTLLIILAIISICLQALAEKKVHSLYGGDRFINDCRAAIVDYDTPSKPAIGAAGEHCLGYVQGLLDTSMMWQVIAAKTPDAQAPLFCLTSTATNEVVIRQVPIWAIEHPEDSKAAAIEFLLSMLKSNYPCGK
jgi:hypothetical protein